MSVQRFTRVAELVSQHRSEDIGAVSATAADGGAAWRPWYLRLAKRNLGSHLDELVEGHALFARHSASGYLDGKRALFIAAIHKGLGKGTAYLGVDRSNGGKHLVGVAVIGDAEWCACVKCGRHHCGRRHGDGGVARA